jgi:hypothetical protein
MCDVGWAMWERGDWERGEGERGEGERGDMERGDKEMGAEPGTRHLELSYHEIG